MKKADFTKGRRGFIIRMYGDTKLSDIHISEVEVEGYRDGYAYVWDWANEQSVLIDDLRDVYYNREDAKKAVLRYLSKQHQKFMKGAVQC